jgi:hypothetical protein
LEIILLVIKWPVEWREEMAGFPYVLISPGSLPLASVMLAFPLG